MGWSGGAKVLCILHHWGVQLILAYSWARPAILVVGKGRGGMFLFLLFLHFHSCSSFFPVPLFHLLYSLLPLFSLSLGDDTKWPSRVDVSLNPNTINQCKARWDIMQNIRTITLVILPLGLQPFEHYKYWKSPFLPCTSVGSKLMKLHINLKLHERTCRTHEL